MAQTATLSALQLARLQHRKGDLHEARLSAEESMTASRQQNDCTSWLEAARIYFQSCLELEETAEAQPVIDQILELARKSTDEKIQGKAEIIIAMWLLANGKLQEAEAYIQSSIHKATHQQDLDTLARALLALATVSAFDPEQYAQSLQHLKKLEVLLTELDNPEFTLTASMLKAHVYIQANKLDLAQELLWSCYEQAKLHGYQLPVSRILAQMAHVHHALGQMDAYRIYSELALRGTDKTRLPRIYKYIRQMCPTEVRESVSQFDFQIDETQRSVFERSKGLIDFRNQHILFDLALLFMKKPGTRYSKEDLIELIWQQPYDPDQHDNLIYVSIKRLRSLLEPDMESPRYILRDRKGYYFNPQTSVQFKTAEEISL